MRSVTKPRAIVSVARHLYCCSDEGTIWKFTNKTRSIFCGNTSNIGHKDGNSTNALFSDSLNGICCDDENNIYVTDGGNHMIRKISTDAGVSTFISQFQTPFGIAFGGGYIFASDFHQSTIWKIDKKGNATIFAGSQEGFKDGGGKTAMFSSPTGLCFSKGVLYVCDTFNHKIRTIDQNGEVSTLVGTNNESGEKDGAVQIASVYFPYSITTDNSGNLFFIQCHFDYRNWLVLRKISGNTVSTVRIFTTTDARTICQITYFEGNVLLCDYKNGTIVEVDGTLS